jgi:N-acetylneuraminic acid mutarotase
MKHWILSTLICIGFLLGTVSPSIQAKDLGSWKLLASTPSTRTEVGVTLLNGKIYVIGGFTPKGIADQVDVYDPATRKWSEAAPLPRALHHVAAVTVNGKIYVIGGFASGMWTPVKTVYEYDPQTNTWTEKAPMLTARGALAAGVVDGKIYAMGGAHKKFFRLTNTGANEVYDPATNEWASLMSLPTPRDHFTISVLNGELYALGGRIDVNFNNNLNANEVYNPKTNRWMALKPLPTPRSGITSQAVNGKIYVFGGETGSGTFKRNEAFDPKTNEWQTMEDMPRRCHGLGSAVVDGKIHLFNGGPSPGGRGSRYHQVYTPPR